MRHRHSAQRSTPFNIASLFQNGFQHPTGENSVRLIAVREMLRLCSQHGQQLGHIPAKNGLAGALSPFLANHPEIHLEVLCLNARSAYFK